MVPTGGGGGGRTQVSEEVTLVCKVRVKGGDNLQCHEPLLAKMRWDAFRQLCRGPAASEQRVLVSALRSGSSLTSQVVLYKPLQLPCFLSHLLWLSLGAPEWLKAGTAAGRGGGGGGGRRSLGLPLPRCLCPSLFLSLSPGLWK